jgi:competence protein ComEA
MKNLLILILFVFSNEAFAVDINTANAEELAYNLSGIGKNKAQRIIEYREKNGGFVSLKQLLEVKGIGAKILARNRDKIEISPFLHTPSRHLTTDNDTPIPRRENAPLLNTTPQKGFPKVEKLPHSNLPISTEGNDVIERFNDPSLNTSPPSLIEDLSHKIKNLLFEVQVSKKLEPRTHNKFWDALIIIPLFGTILFIFVMAWFKGTKKDKPILRKHLLSTTFVCSGCGKVGSFQNVRYKGHFNSQYLDGDLPPGWSCISNWLGEPCDYCFDCSKD